MLIPGNFTVPQPGSPIPEIPKKALRIARIYVSQRDTVYNGRINWNIPKHLARFEFSHPPTPKGVAPPSQLDVRVFPASTTDVDEIDPFFSCSLKPWKWIPSVPVSTRYLPLSTAMAQPPVPAAAGFHEAAKEEGEGKSSWKNEYRGGDPRYCIKPEYEKALLAGTDRWCYMPIHSYAPRARGCWVSVHTPKRDVHSANEPDKHWPQDIVPWSVGAWMVCFLHASDRLR